MEKKFKIIQIYPINKNKQIKSLKKHHLENL